jgi:hypothetical protein
VINSHRCASSAETKAPRYLYLTAYFTANVKSRGVATRTAEHRRVKTAHNLQRSKASNAVLFDSRAVRQPAARVLVTASIKQSTHALCGKKGRTAVRRNHFYPCVLLLFEVLVTFTNISELNIAKGYAMKLWQNLNTERDHVRSTFYVKTGGCSTTYFLLTKIILIHTHYSPLERSYTVMIFVFDDIL